MKTKIKNIKNIFFTTAIAGLAMLFGCIKSIYACGAGFAPISGVCFPTTTGLADTDTSDVLVNFMQWILVIFGILAIIAFVISGFQYFMAAGDEGQAEIAKRNLKYSIIGVVVGLSGYIILNAVTEAYNLNPFF